MCAESTSSPPAATSSPGGAGLGCSHQAYLDGGHLCISPPAEALELQGVVAKAHSPAGRRGAFLQLELQVVKVREIMVPCWSGEERTPSPVGTQRERREDTSARLMCQQPGG